MNCWCSKEEREKFDKSIEESRKKRSELKQLLSKEILVHISDKAVQDIMREILFSDKWIDWENIESIVYKHRPDLKFNQK